MRLLADILIGFGLLVLLGVAVKVVVRRIKNSIDRDRRDRAAYEAEIAKMAHDRLSAKDELEVAEFEAFVEEVRTGEQTLVLGSTWAFEADPLSAPIPDDHAHEAARLFGDVTAEWLSTFTWLSDPAPSVPLSSVQVPDVEPLELEGPTGVFPKDWLAVAEAKAAAR